MFQSKLATIVALAVAMAPQEDEPLVATAKQKPIRDWMHDDERVRKAEEKRQRKQAKRISMREGE